ncbi:MAG: hypothetical protein ACRYG8_13235, partial [Janthinobacterium lividum]
IDTATNAMSFTGGSAGQGMQFIHASATPASALASIQSLGINAADQHSGTASSTSSGMTALSQDATTADSWMQTVLPASSPVVHVPTAGMSGSASMLLVTQGTITVGSTIGADHAVGVLQHS